MRSEAPPALVVLHGHDSSSERALELARELDAERSFAVVAPNGPVELESGTFAWFDSATGTGLAESVRLVADLLGQLRADDPDRVVVLSGFSQGAATALAAAAHRGIRVDGLVVMSGFVAEAPGVDYQFDQLAGVPVLVQHGSGDEVVPDFFADDIVALLGAVGADVVDQRFPIGHTRSEDSVAAASAFLAQVATS